MKKILALAVVAILLCACAGNKNIVMLDRKEINKMSSGEVTSFYKASNKDLLTTLIYENGGSTYERLTTVFANMNTELNALGNLNTTKDNYYARLEKMVKKYRAQVDAAVK